MLSGVITTMADSDAELIVAVRAGSVDAVARLIRRHWGRCHRLAYVMVGDAAAAEDVAQEAILSAIDALHGFDEGRPLEPWLHRIVVNEATDWLRRQARAPGLVADADGFRSIEVEPEFPFALGGDLLDELRRLRPEYRLVIVLRYVLDYTPAEIGQALDVPAPTVRTHLRRALSELRRAIEREEDSSAVAP
jgi:RNA polymerase sigma-70 factor (ECF subfamily)